MVIILVKKLGPMVLNTRNQPQEGRLELTDKVSPKPPNTYSKAQKARRGQVPPLPFPWGRFHKSWTHGVERTQIWEKMQ